MTLSDYVKREDSRVVVQNFVDALLTPTRKDPEFCDAVVGAGRILRDTRHEGRQKDLTDALIERLRGIWEPTD